MFNVLIQSIGSNQIVYITYMLMYCAKANVFLYACILYEFPARDSFFYVNCSKRSVII